MTAEELLPEAHWTSRERRHRRRVDEFLAPHRGRAQTGEPHPVWDFLFRYYSLRPRQLRVWHPGFGVVLGGPDSGAVRAYLDRAGYGPHPDGVTVTSEHLRSRVGTVEFIVSGRWCTGRRPCGTNACRFGSDRTQPTPLSSRYRCAAPISTRPVLHRARGREKRGHPVA